MLATLTVAVVIPCEFWEGLQIDQRASLVAQRKRIHLPMQEMWVQSLSQEDSLEKEMATHCSILAWEIPWTEEPGGLQSMGHKELDMT